MSKAIPPLRPILGTQRPGGYIESCPHEVGKLCQSKDCSTVEALGPFPTSSSKFKLETGQYEDKILIQGYLQCASVGPVFDLSLATPGLWPSLTPLSWFGVFGMVYLSLSFLLSTASFSHLSFLSKSSLLFFYNSS